MTMIEKKKKTEERSTELKLQFMCQRKQIAHKLFWYTGHATQKSIPFCAIEHILKCENGQTLKMKEMILLLFDDATSLDIVSHKMFNIIAIRILRFFVAICVDVFHTMATEL